MVFTGLLKLLKHMFVSSSFRVGEHDWFYRVSEGEYEWVAALTAHPKDVDLYDPYNPFTVYAYKVRDPETGWEGYILAVYPRGCGESACALFVHTEATDEDLVDWMEAIAEIAPLYYSSPGRFYEELESGDMRILSPEEMEQYEFIHPTPAMAKTLVGLIRRRRFVEVRRIPLAKH